MKTENQSENKAVLLNALKELQVLKNAIGDLVPAQAYQTVQLSNFETLLMNNRYTPLTQQRVLLAYLYQEHGIIQTAVDQPVQDALRGGLDITSGEMDNDDISELQKYLENNNILEIVGEAEIWKRLFGGAGIIINMEVDPAQPFKHEKTKKLEFYACDRWELAAGQGPKAELFNFYGTEIHQSRVIKFIGRKAPSFIRPQLQGWGMSEVERMVRDLNAYIKNKNLIFELLDESKIDVYKIKGFNTSLITGPGTAKIQKRMEVGNQLKNYQNAIVMDVNDEYEQKTLTYSGLAEMIKENRIGIASALKMPMTKLFGLSAAGFNSGEDDIENYNSMIESEIRSKLRQPLRIILSLCCVQLFGYIPELDFEFKPLRMMSEREEEEINTSRHNRLLTLYDRGLLSAEELGKSLDSYKLMPVKTEMEQGLLPEVTPPAAASSESGPTAPPTGGKVI